MKIIEAIIIVTSMSTVILYIFLKVFHVPAMNVSLKENYFTETVL